MADRTYLNVKYGNITTEIKMEGVNRLGDLQDKIKAKYGDDIKASAARIQLFEKDDIEITGLDDIPGEYYIKSKDGGSYMEVRTSPPPSREPSLSMSDADSSRPSSADRWGSQNAVLLGKRDSGMDGEGINLDSQKILKRISTTERIVSHLEKTSVLLIKSPPMTGKTSMAALVTDYLCKNVKQKCLVIPIAMPDLSYAGSDWGFERAFELTIGIKWGDLASIMRYRVIYFIFDEFQTIYRRKSSENEANLPDHNSSVVWASIKSAMSTRNSICSPGCIAMK